MARRPRGDEPGRWHHVINRGIAKRPLFEARGDMRFFLARLVRQIRLGRVELHAYCLLHSHFHLLVRSPVGELSEAMRRVQNEHSRRFNRLHRRDGALIRGRYFSKPVDSLEYRHTLVRYIDGNAVRAGVAAPGGAYEFGSSAAYLLGTGPRWLTRTWVEEEACLTTGSARFGPDAYRAAFGARSAAELHAIDELIEARMARPALADPLEDLIGTAPPHVQAWMQRKARLADGERLGLPVCGRQALAAALDVDKERRGVWISEDGARTRRRGEVARAGLLRDLCGGTWSEVASSCQTTEAVVRRLSAHHRRLLAEDPEYARRVAEVGSEALALSLGARGAARLAGPGGSRLRAVRTCRG